jgi:hypothetical protein
MLRLLRRDNVGVRERLDDRDRMLRQKRRENVDRYSTIDDPCGIATSRRTSIRRRVSLGQYDVVSLTRNRGARRQRLGQVYEAGIL